jgi:tetratricopeptide (TPR) repeat protein
MAAAAPTIGADQSRAQPATVSATSKLSAWCDRLIETGWLAAIVVVPLLFNIYSSRVFEPDKLTTLRSIALFMALAWLVRWIEEFRNPGRDRGITWRTPLVLPTLVLIVVYMISTALSVAPRTSLLGSYQRLQGTYTTLSYIVVFLLIVQGLRTRAQLDRLVTIMVINSLPIAMYGLLQRMQLDPLPWGGDTTERVAGNMGNSIFIAAYLVMTFFITLYRVADSFVAIFQSEQPRWSDVVRAACYILITLFNAIVVLILAGSRGPQLGWLGGILFFTLLLVQLIRRRKTRLVLTGASIVLALGGLGFLVFLNVTRPDPNLAWLRQFPLFNRLSTVLTTTEGTNAVRMLIWQGASQLVSPHEPITRPDGTPDPFNAIRPLVGYGPESMYVAYNRYYPPELANFEARNASPDRSHNETWDSLVITGIFGFLAYMFLFGSVLFYGFRWVGLIASRFEARLFVILWIVGGALTGGFMLLSGNTELFGVSLAAGIVLLGLMPFLFISALINARRGDDEALPVRLSLRDQMLLIAIVSTVVAHFVEIHTGIAIAATRTHFWVLIGVMVVVGAGMLRETNAGVDAIAEGRGQKAEGPESSPVRPVQAQPAHTAGGTRRQRRAAQQAATTRRTVASNRIFGLPGWFGTVAAYGLFLGLILGVMSFDFTNNTERLTNPGQVFLGAMARVNGEAALGVLGMFVITFIVGTVIIVAELRRSDVLRSNESTFAAAMLIGSIALLIWVAFGTFIAGRLVDFITAQQSTVAGILGIADQLGAFPAYVYLLVAVVMVTGAFLLRDEDEALPAKSMSAGGMIALCCGAIAVPVAIAYSNLQPIAADIIYKQANPWDQEGSRELVQGTGIQGWDLAIEHYRRAIDLARNEDFYYLWLGRALLEKAKSTTNPSTDKLIPDDAQFTRIIGNEPDNWNRPSGSDVLPSASLSREDLLTAARVILEEARVINPLNTDHSANLARMWQQAADVTTDAAVRQQRFENASREYAKATSLSPNNAQLWNEWARLELFNLRDMVGAQDKLDRSLELDRKFSQTYLLRAALSIERAAALDRQTDEAAWRDALERARNELYKALAADPNAVQAYQELTRISLQLDDPEGAISATQALVQKSPGDWNALRNLAVIYSDTKQISKAIDYAQQAFDLAPPEQRPVLEALVQQLSDAR